MKVRPRMFHLEGHWLNFDEFKVHSRSPNVSITKKSGWFEECLEFMRAIQFYKNRSRALHNTKQQFVKREPGMEASRPGRQTNKQTDKHTQAVDLLWASANLLNLLYAMEFYLAFSIRDTVAYASPALLITEASSGVRKRLWCSQAMMQDVLKTWLKTSNESIESISLRHHQFVS